VRSDLQELAVFELTDGEMVRDPSVPTLSDQPAQWSAVITSDGTIEVAAVLGHYTLRTGSHLVQLERSAGNWSEHLMDSRDPQVTFGMSMASGPSDSLHVAYFAYRAGFLYTRAGSTRRLSVEPECDEGEVRIAIDVDDQPHLLYDCDYASPSYLAPIERYGADYVDACSAGARLICDRACSCGEPDCCYNDGTPDGSNGCYFGPGSADHDLCAAEMLVGLCSDLTADPAAMLACKPILDASTPECIDMGYAIPGECWELIQTNR
jgi:hypothetical protein